MAEILKDRESVAERLKAAAEAQLGKDEPDPTSVRVAAIKAQLGHVTAASEIDPSNNSSGHRQKLEMESVPDRRFPSNYSSLTAYMDIMDCPAGILASYQSQAFKAGDWENAILFQRALLDKGGKKMPGLIFLAKALEMTGRVQQAIDVRLEIAGFSADNPLNNAALKRLNYAENDYDATLPADYRDLTNEQLESIAKFSTGRVLLYAKAAWLDKRSLRHIVLFTKTLLDRPGYNGPHNPNGVVTTKIHLAMAYRGLGFLDDALTLQYELRDIHHQSNPNHAKIIEELEDLIRNKKLRTANASKTASR